jgi:biopolymer transport protein ExbD
MSLKSRNKVSVEFNMASMTDLVFILLIFFMLLSTLVTNQAVMDITLPQTSASQRPVDKHPMVAVSAELQYYIDQKPVTKEEILPTLSQMLGPGTPETKVQIAVDENVPFKYFAELADLIWVQGKYRILLTTQPKK